MLTKYIFPGFTGLLILSLFSVTISNAQPLAWYDQVNGSFYASAGYNMSWYDLSTIHIRQAGMGNSYDLVAVDGDKKNLDGATPLGLTYKIGYFFNHRQDMGIEVSYSQVSYHITNGQTVFMQGTEANAPVDNKLNFSSEIGDYYYLRGGNILINYVQRFGIYRSRRNTVSIDFLAKGGVGPTVSQRFQYSFNGNMSNSNSLQASGWNAGLEPAFRFTFFRYVYMEVAPQLDFAFYSNMPVSGGSAKQNLTTSSLIGSIGFTLPTTKHNPRFIKIEKEHKPVTIPDNFDKW